MIEASVGDAVAIFEREVESWRLSKIALVSKLEVYQSLCLVFSPEFLHAQTLHLALLADRSKQEKGGRRSKLKLSLIEQLAHDALAIKCQFVSVHLAFRDPRNKNDHSAPNDLTEAMKCLAKKIRTARDEIKASADPELRAVLDSIVPLLKAATEKGCLGPCHKLADSHIANYDCRVRSHALIAIGHVLCAQPRFRVHFPVAAVGEHIGELLYGTFSVDLGPALRNFCSDRSFFDGFLTQCCAVAEPVYGALSWWLHKKQCVQAFLMLATNDNRAFFNHVTADDIVVLQTVYISTPARRKLIKKLFEMKTSPALTAWIEAQDKLLESKSHASSASAHTEAVGSDQVDAAANPDTEAADSSFSLPAPASTIVSEKVSAGSLSPSSRPLTVAMRKRKHLAESDTDDAARKKGKSSAASHDATAAEADLDSLGCFITDDELAELRAAGAVSKL